MRLMLAIKSGNAVAGKSLLEITRDLVTVSDALRQGYPTVVAAITRFMSRWPLFLLLGVYALAAFVPASSLWGREIEFGELNLLGETSRITLSMALLAMLLFNAGLDIPMAQLRKLIREPALLGIGLAANLVIPVVYICSLSYALRNYSDPGTVQILILGLALIASMPIAGSSAAWAQNANGNLALSLGLILCSTVLSPLTTPALLHSVGWLASGDYSSGLAALANTGMSIFLTVFVLVPAVCGLGVRWLVGDGLAKRVMPTLKMLNTFILLLLTYTNASGALPPMVANPDWALLGLGLTASLGMCVIAFAAGWVLANRLHADEGQRTALMFGLGLNISSPGLVLASVAFAHMPEVMLPALLYTLVQHVVAGAVTFWGKRQPAASRSPAAVAFPPLRIRHPVMTGARPATLVS
jgi:BASS family bile acid:Na+ symporter